LETCGQPGCAVRRPAHTVLETCGQPGCAVRRPAHSVLETCGQPWCAVRRPAHSVDCPKPGPSGARSSLLLLRRGAQPTGGHERFLCLCLGTLKRPTLTEETQFSGRKLPTYGGPRRRSRTETHHSNRHVARRALGGVAPQLEAVLARLQQEVGALHLQLLIGLRAWAWAPERAGAVTVEGQRFSLCSGLPTGTRP